MSFIRCTDDYQKKIDFDDLDYTIRALADITHKLKPEERKFVEDMYERLETYDDSIKISSKQLKWLKSIYERF